MVLLTESAGKNEQLYAAPAHAPESADSHGKMSFFVKVCPVLRDRWDTRREATNSFEVNQAAFPPSSRMNVPKWPTQRPRIPSVRITVIRMDIGPGSLTAAADEEEGAMMVLLVASI